IFRLERIEKRLREGKKITYHEDMRDLSRLSHYRKLRDEFHQQFQRGCQREDEAILGLHGERAFEPEELLASLKEGDKRFEHLLRELYVLRFDEPDRATLAVFSEQPEPLWALTQAYAELITQRGGTCELWQFLPEREKSDRESSPDRRRVIDPRRAFAG